MKTVTAKTTITWERTTSGWEALYGDFVFRVTKWMPGSYTATCRNLVTKEQRLDRGQTAGEVPSVAYGKSLCEECFRQIRREDVAAGIERF
jgi:hypothetical protein